MDQPGHTMTKSEWVLRLRLYLIWTAAGSALSGLQLLPLPETVVKWATFLLGITVAVVGAWRAFLDRSTPTLPSEPVNLPGTQATKPEPKTTATK